MFRCHGAVDVEVFACSRCKNAWSCGKRPRNKPGNKVAKNSVKITLFGVRMKSSKAAVDNDVERFGCVT